MKNVIKKGFLSIILALLFVAAAPSALPENTGMEYVEAASVKLSATNATLTKGQTKKLKIKGTSKKVTWSSSKKSVATVSSTGKVTAVKKGTAKIRAKVGKQTYTCKITVEDPKISKKSTTLAVGVTKTLKVSGTSQAVTWSSSKKSVATVSSKGKVTAVKKGTATITAKVGGKKYTCKVKVENPKISKTSASLTKGKTLTLKISGTTQTVKWSSNKTSVATVSSKGKVTAKKAGTATITATVSGKKLTCKVTVKNATSSSGTRTNPKSAYTSITTDIYDYSTYLGKFTIQLLDYKDGNEAYNYVKTNEFNDKPKSNQEYIYVKFKIKYVSGSKEVTADQVINHYSNFYNSAANKQLNNIGWAFDFEDVEDMVNVSLYPGGSATCSKAILISSGNTPITYRLQTGYDKSTYEPIYTWFTTKK